MSIYAYLRLSVASFVLAGVCFAPAVCATQDFTMVSARAFGPAAGQDAGVDLTGASMVYVSASGSISKAGSACGTAIGPQGCAKAFIFNRPAQDVAPEGLIAAFADRAGRPISRWYGVPDLVRLAVPSGAARLLLRINGASGTEVGAFHVAASVSRSANSGATTLGVRRLFNETRQVSTGTIMTRKLAHYTLRRFGFSGTPAEVDTVYAAGVHNWLVSQFAADPADAAITGTYLNAIPLVPGTEANVGFDDLMRARLVQRLVASNWQVQAKMLTHWLQHYSINQLKLDPYAVGPMTAYEDVILRNEFGNFKTMMKAVSKTPDMLVWLDNNNNVGTNPTLPPNENFARELMQLYMLGEVKLNMDGSPMLDSTGQPIPAYSEDDVKTIAKALTGFHAYNNWPYKTPNVAYDKTWTVTFVPTKHAPGPYTIFGSTVVNDPGDATIVDAIVEAVSKQPSHAPFMAKEMLQRFVTETPSPGYISRVAKVWAANEDDPHQLQKVILAIADDPEFALGIDSQIKEPIEFGIDAVRALGGERANPVTVNSSVLNQYSLGADLRNMQQDMWYPDTVFAFYIPGYKSALVSDDELLARWSTVADITNHLCLKAPCSAGFQMAMDLTNLGGKTPTQTASYLLDALIDGGTPSFRQVLANYLANPNATIAGAVYVILTSPEYEVN